MDIKIPFCQMIETKNCIQFKCMCAENAVDEMLLWYINVRICIQNMEVEWIVEMMCLMMELC